MTADELAVKLRPVFAAFGREATIDLLDAYFRVLGKVPRAYVDRGVQKALEANREFLPPPGVLRAMCGAPPRCTGDGIPLPEETRRLQLKATTCDWHSDADNWHGDDPPPAIEKTCPKCREVRGLIAAAPPTRKLKGTGK